MSDITDDEFTVLMLAANGESIAAIGRWEKSCDSLVARGFLYRHDKFNNTITSAGRQACEARDKEDDAAYGQLLELGGRIANARATAVAAAEQAAQQLAVAAKAASEATGDSIQAAIDQWLKAVKVRALEILGK